MYNALVPLGIIFHSQSLYLSHTYKKQCANLTICMKQPKGLSHLDLGYTFEKWDCPQVLESTNFFLTTLSAVKYFNMAMYTNSKILVNIVTQYKDVRNSLIC